MLWTTHGCIANYFSPTDLYNTSLIKSSWDAYTTHAGDRETQLELSNIFWESCLNDEPMAPFNNAFVLDAATNAKNYFKSRGLDGMIGYEGGQSPEYINGDHLFYITAATKAPQCVVTCYPFPNTSPGGFYHGSYFPIEVGMGFIPNVLGMTQLNITENGRNNLTFSNGSATITAGDAHGFVVDDAICFGANYTPVYDYIPDEIVPATAYYVKTVPSASTFTIATAKGGTAIVFTLPAKNGGGLYAKKCWRVTAVDRANFMVTLDVNSSGFSTFTHTNDSPADAPVFDSHCYAKLAWGSSIVNTLAYDGKSCANLALVQTQAYQNWYGLSDRDFEVINFSNFIYYAPGNPWSIKDPDPWAPDPLVWVAIHDWNSND
jgi:hypothetical protein